MANYRKKIDETATEPKGPGRPANAENREYDIVPAELTRCLKCGSTDRTPYQGSPDVLRQPGSDVTVVTTWRRCQCRQCGQWRKDKYQQTETT